MAASGDTFAILAREVLHQENPFLLFVMVLFSLSAKKKSSNTRTYHLLIKRNLRYFLGAFVFHLFGEIGVAFNKSTYFGKVENLNTNFIYLPCVSRC